MAVKSWCKVCYTATDLCSSEPTHKKESWGWRTDYRVGGRFGERVRHWHKKKEDAESEEINDKADHNRGLYRPRESQSTLIVSDLLDRYFKDHCLLNTRNSGRHTKYMIDKLKECIGRKQASVLSRKDVKEMRTGLLAEELSAAYVNRLTHGVLAAAFSWAVEEEIIKDNPCRQLPKLPIEEPAPRFLTREEIATVYKFFTTQKLRDYADILYHTGARPSSIKACSWDNGDVDLETKQIWFTTYKGKRNSLKRYRYSVPMDADVVAIVKRRAEETGKKGLVFDTSGVDKAARLAIEESKINEGKTTPFTIYGLKHCYASHLLMNGASLFAVSKLLGHTDTKMVEKHYGHLTQEHLRIEQAKLNKPTELTIIKPEEKTA